MPTGTYRILSKTADLHTLPCVLEPDFPEQQITFGDLHSNSVKLVYLLVLHGICQMERDHYQLLLTYYNTPLCNKSQRQAFDDLIHNHLHVIRKDIFIRLIGDELADRGQNDYFTLVILQKLKICEVQFSILFSNHGGEFLLSREKYHHLYERNINIKLTIVSEHTRSLTALNQALVQNIITQNEIEQLLRYCYFPHLKLAEATIDREQNHITLYSHAPVGPEQIKSAANFFHLAYDDSTHVSLAQTIEAINNCFREVILNRQLHHSFSPDNIRQARAYGLIDPEFSIAFFAWNRDHLEIKRPDWQRDYWISYVHGHDDAIPALRHIKILNHELGMGDGCNKGLHQAIVSCEINVRAWQLIHNQDQLANAQALVDSLASAPCQESNRSSAIPIPKAFRSPEIPCTLPRYPTMFSTCLTKPPGFTSHHRHEVGSSLRDHEARSPSPVAKPK